MNADWAIDHNGKFKGVLPCIPQGCTESAPSAEDAHDGCI